jgi:hypothetical protein
VAVVSLDKHSCIEDKIWQAIPLHKLPKFSIADRHAAA